MAFKNYSEILHFASLCSEWQCDVNNEYHIRVLVISYKKTTASDGLSDVLLRK
jgi:hypothetical protein